jgi:hypothetical protein
MKKEGLMETRTPYGHVPTNSAYIEPTTTVVEPATTESEFIVDNTPIYARVQKRRANLGLMLGVPLAVIATGAIVLATSQPKNDLLVDGPVGPATAPAATTPPVVRAPSGITPAAAPTPARIAPAPVRRTAAARPAPAADVTVAARDASAVVAPIAPPVVASPAAPVVEAAPSPLPSAEPETEVSAPPPVDAPVQ